MRTLIVATAALGLALGMSAPVFAKNGTSTSASHSKGTSSSASNSKGTSTSNVNKDR
jgi:hypothetical protein